MQYLSTKAEAGKAPTTKQIPLSTIYEEAQRTNQPVISVLGDAYSQGFKVFQD